MPKSSHWTRSSDWNGIPALTLWDQLLEVLAPSAVKKRASPYESNGSSPDSRTALEELLDVDYTPPTYPMSTGAMKLVVFEDNESVVKMIVK